LQNGDVTTINDFITLNLDIIQFARDAIDRCEDADVLRAFYKAISNVTVLDPTCGSGAFLFAALNILEPLYDMCLIRMQHFVDDLDRSGEKHSPKKFSDFRETLQQVEDHASRAYFIYKTIILKNLFGVDIMAEATEICKLRLFLKLVSQIENVEDLEPLPDIDFNIRAGNTLVGFATFEDVKRTLKTDLVKQLELPKIQERTENAAKAFKQFREQQTQHGGNITAGHKKELRDRLADLENELNRYLATEYNIIDPDKQHKKYAEWLATHQPFHWFVDFYAIMESGGFDIIIGNPPYVEYRKVQKSYNIKNYRTESCGDLYAFIIERSFILLKEYGKFGMIIPISIVSADGFSDLRKLFINKNIKSWITNFAERPSKLFNGVEKRLTIWLSDFAGGEGFFISKYHRWLSEERDHLLGTTKYVDQKAESNLVKDAIAKISTPLEMSILEKIQKHPILYQFYRKNANHIVYYTRKLRYFVQFFDFIPKITDEKDNALAPTELKEIRLNNSSEVYALIALLNSTLFFWFFNAFSDVRNVNRRELDHFRSSLNKLSSVSEISSLARKLMKDFEKNSKILTNNYGKFGIKNIQTFQPRVSKPIIDEIDRVLAQHYGFTDEELDFIINYDIKYRMGIDVDE
jgi:hypothetical protein